ncbi:MAG: LamG domain-containing protein [Planctomycetota bacterium]
MMRRKLIYLVSFVLVLSGASNVSADLVGHWKFDGNLDDSAGSANDTFDGGMPNYVVGKFEQALEFDGTDDFVNLPYTSDPTVYTISAWVKPVRISPASIVVRTSDAGPTTHWSHQLRIQSSGVFEHYAWDGSERRVLGTTVIKAGTWYSVVLVATNNGDVRLYVNGQEEGTATTIGTLWADGDRFLVGSNSGHEMGWFEGVVDDLRIYDKVLSAAEIAKLASRPEAFGPDPSNGSLHQDTWMNLSWTPGCYAVSHDVYFAENFDDVNYGAEGTFQGNQVGTFFVVGFPGFPYPDGLVPGTTYYWRIDEVNDTEPNSPWKGEIWSFSIPPRTAYAPEPSNGAELIDPNVELSWTGGFGSKLHTVYFGDNFDDVNNAAGGLPQGATTYTPGTLKLAKTYYWRVDEFDAIETHKGDVWSFTTQGAVGSPDPSNGAVDIKQTPILTWSPNVYAASHEVYFGTDKDAVKNADTGSPEYKGTRDLGAESYDPGKLLWDATYYWRIDEVNNVNPDSPWTGILWSFTTANFLVVDDFENYDVNDNQIWFAWHDGLGYGTPGTEPYFAGNGTGSAVGDENTASYTEETIVHGGSQSMPVFYDNSILRYSEVEKMLTYPRDWTENGVNTLSIWFRGDSANSAETLYVALNGSALVNHDNPNAAQITTWTQWNIDLQAFAEQGVNLANVNNIALGLGNRNPDVSGVAGGSGTMYFDDIRLYPPPPEPAP